MIDSHSEHYKFGPWIYEISSKNPMPPLFEPYYKADNDYLLLVKVPRNVDRKDVKPGMDLYDYIIGLCENVIYILKRVGTKVEETKFTYLEIEAIEDQRDLLKGKLTIYLKRGKLIIPYNTSSAEMVNKITTIIRNRYTNKVHDILNAAYPSDGVLFDGLYNNLFKDMKSCDHDLKVYAYQPPVFVTLRNGNPVKKMVHRLIRTQLLDTLHLINQKELIIISRGESFRTRSDSVYSYAFTYVPLDRLLRVEFHEHNFYDRLMELKLDLTGSGLCFCIDQGNQMLMDRYHKLSRDIKYKRFE